ncbi:hypothetical protein K440DRAFT_640386 [Wilcoxina mikolae CBS 423.85]|nr:hypothetical protein K440DRAFT_640386 [Wilcoxina mikolae CBS 423.85]
MLPLNILLLALPLVYAAPTPAPTPAAIASPIKPIFGSWGDAVRPFKPGMCGDKFNPTPEPQNLTTPPPLPPRAPAPPKKAEAELPGSKGQKQAKESQNRNDVTRMAASNSVALFNGVPVDPHTGQPINPPIEEPEEESLQKRGLLKKKLGLQFLDDPNVDDKIVREHLKSPEIGMGLAAPKGQHPTPMAIPPGAPAAAANALPAVMAPTVQAQAQAPQQPKQTQKQPWNGNAYMVVNGVPMAVEGDATGKALDISKFAPGNTLQKRGDIRSKLGLGMFDVPGVSGRRKTSAPPPEEEVEYEEVALEDPVAAPEPAPEPVYELPEVHHQEEVEELELQDLGKSFVIYNGMPVEINGTPVRNKKLKKPRPAFRGNLEKREADAEPAAGRKYTGLNPFKSNPITGHQRGNGNNANNPNNKAKDKTNGATNSNIVKGTEHTSQSPHTSEEEVVRINTGDSTCLFNGRPVTLSGNSLFDGMEC